MKFFTVRCAKCDDTLKIEGPLGAKAIVVFDTREEAEHFLKVSISAQDHPLMVSQVDIEEPAGIPAGETAQ
jgi:hypothetical protein